MPEVANITVTVDESLRRIDVVIPDDAVRVIETFHGPGINASAYMQTAIYDPDDVADNAFDLANHSGTLDRTDAVIDGGLL